MIYPARLVKALPLVFSVGADHDSVTLVVDVVAPLDEPLEFDVEATGVEATGVEATVLPVPVLVGGAAIAGEEHAARLGAGWSGGDARRLGDLIDDLDRAAR